MTHILSALFSQNMKIYNITYKKEVDKLVEDLEQMKNTVQSQVNRASMVVFKKQIDNDDRNIDKGKLACGYNDKVYDKGINLILKAFGGLNV